MKKQETKAKNRTIEQGICPVIDSLPSTLMVDYVEGVQVPVAICDKLPEFTYEDCTTSAQMRTGVKFGAVQTGSNSALEVSEKLERGISDALLETKLNLPKGVELKQEEPTNNENNE